MATHCVAHHFTQIVQRIALGGDGVAERGGNVTALRLVLGDLEDDPRSRKHSCTEAQWLARSPLRRGYSAAGPVGPMPPFVGHRGNS
jgi:hypothetical protein